MTLARSARLFAFTVATAFAASLVVPSVASAQAKKYIPPVKGVAKIQMTKPAPKNEGNEIVTVIKIKNMMEGTIAGLRVDEYWYDKSNKMVTGDTQRVKVPVQPGEIVTVTLRTKKAPGMDHSQYQVSHANGTVKTEPVSKLQ